MIFPICLDADHPLIDIVFQISLYFRDGHLPEVRLRMAQAAEEFIDLVADRLTHHQVPGGRGLAGFSKSRFLKSAYRHAEKSPPHAPFIGLAFEQHKYLRSAPHTELYFATIQDWEQERNNSMSYIRFSFPLDWFISGDRPHPHHLMQRWTHILRAEQGRGGVGFTLALGLEDWRRAEPFLTYLAALWPNIMMELRGSTRDYMCDAMREPNWLTAVGSKYLDRLGGAEAVRTQLATLPGFEISGYEGGLLIQAGIEPDPSFLPIFSPDVRWLIDPRLPLPPAIRDDACVPAPPAPGPTDYPHLVHLARVLKPVRTTSLGRRGRLHWGGLYWEPAPPGAYMDADWSMAWINRYDTPSPWDAFRFKSVSDIERLRRMGEAMTQEPIPYPIFPFK